MARKRRSSPGADRPDSAAPVAAPAAAPTSTVAPVGGLPPLPAEAAGGGVVVLVLALMMFLAPTLGVPNELMLQDTLKSIVVSLMTLGAALVLLFQVRQRTTQLRWHGIAWLPLLLMVYALGSMAWAHPYLGGVEAVRWFIFSLLVWLGLNTLSRERLPWLAWGIHLGGLVAALWAALQFWVGMDLFPQGPNPASTFVNRNFFAEFVVCTLPFGWLLLSRARASAGIALLAASSGFVVTAILMTGTRAALIALWLQLLVVFPLIAWRCRAQLGWTRWSRGLQALAALVMVGTVLVLGVIPSANPKILDEERGTTAIARGLTRTQSIGPNDYSLNVRKIMWKATLEAIHARPLAGLGAGAWESEIPLYQAEGSQLETDYYVHNEFLQLVAEYGIVGWVFLWVLAGYLLLAAVRTWQARDAEAGQDQPWRAVFLCSLLAFLVVSNVGFPWRMATTGALFALCLAGLAASDARLGFRSPALARPLRWSPRIAQASIAATVACMGLALYISNRAADAEAKLVSAVKIALSISSSGNPNNPQFAAQKKEMLQLAKEGIALNPHYRKITPMIADELARWGDWKDATWIWESVLRSRPYVAAILSNAARGYSSMGEMSQALVFLERARRIQPRAPAVRSLEVILLARAGKEPEALKLAKEALDAELYDFDLINALAILASRAKDYPLAARALELRARTWPQSRPEAYMQLGTLYADKLKDDAKAMEAFRAGLEAAPAAQRESLRGQLPEPYRSRLPAAPSTPPAGTQTSASSK
jgi:O-antigen ligase